jgi:pimeloyl-ACP methyl ester carboxylesterase
MMNAWISPWSRFLTAAALAVGLAACAQQPTSAAAGVVMEEFMIPSPDQGVQLYVRNKHPAGMSSFRADNVVLMVHGATYPGETAFDLPLDGFSWMDYLARNGYDTYMVDVRGYGKSTRPAEMQQPARDNPPIADTATAARDCGAAVDFILQRRGIEQLDLLGWSWGTMITPLYTVAHNDKVHRLVLYAPLWMREKANADTSPLGAYRTVTVAQAKSRMKVGIPAGKQALPDAWFDAWADATFATDPVGSQADPKYLRAPNGVVADGRKYWSGGGKSVYDPADIRVPTLLVVAEWDNDTPTYMAHTLLPKLVNADPKRLVIVGEGTHFLLIEKNRMQLFKQVQMFLDEGRAPRM